VTAPRARISSSPLLVDGLLALGLTGLSIVTLAAGAQDIGSYSPASVALLLLQTIPIALRRVAPLPVLALTFGATMLHALLAEDSLNSTLGALIALFSVAERYDRRISGAAALVMAGVLGLLIAQVAGLPDAFGSLVQNMLSIMVAWVLGTWARERRAYIGTVEDRALRAEREREERAHRAVADERERIARELHDVAAHHVSVIVIQAGAARRALEKRPADAREAIDAIDATARRALGDMRRMVGVLGAGDGSSGPAGDTLEPMPGLDRLGTLIESVRSAGLPVELSIEGTPRPLDPGVELSAYRIVQEALTNTLKHAGGGRANVLVRYAPTALDLRVTDEGGRRTPGPVTWDSGGHGLIGMRERVAIFGGTLEAGPSAGGFRVAAHLPLDATAGA